MKIAKGYCVCMLIEGNLMLYELNARLSVLGRFWGGKLVKYHAKQKRRLKEP